MNRYRASCYAMRENGFAPIIILVGVLIISVIIGIYYLQIKHPTDDQKILNTIPTQIPKASLTIGKLTPTLDPTPITASCKTGLISQNSVNKELVDYKSIRCNFSFSYPKNWSIDEWDNTQAIRAGDMTDPANADPISVQGHTLVDILRGTGKISSNYPYANGSDQINKTIVPYAINGYSGNRGKQDSMFGIQEKVELQVSDNEWIEFILTGNNTKMFDQILSTFKVLNKTNP